MRRRFEEFTLITARLAAMLPYLSVTSAIASRFILSTALFRESIRVLIQVTAGFTRRGVASIDGFKLRFKSETP